MEVHTVGVLGAGVIGTGVAQNLAQASYSVILIDLSQEILSNAKTRLLQDLRFSKMFAKDVALVDPQSVLARIVFSTRYELLGDADFIIENVVEKWEVKKHVYGLIDNICSQECIFGSNTSAIPITQIASATLRPPKVIGLHFMNPVPMKHTVELIPGHHTSPETIETAKNLLRQMNKDFVVVNDAPGFVSNRVLMLTINEAIFVVQEHVASPKDVDRIFKSCFEHKMGPLETADLIGLDTVLFSLEVLYKSFNDTKYRPSPLLRKMVSAGLLGKKASQGFYKY